MCKSNQQGKSKLEEELDVNKFLGDIENELKYINYEMFVKYFKYAAPTIMTKTFKTKAKKKNSDLVKLIKMRWSIFKRWN